MSYIALGVVALAFFMWTSAKSGRVIKRREWRFIAAAAAIAAFAAAAFTGLKGSWGSAIVLMVVGLSLVVSTRRAAPASAPPPASRMSAAEARSVLGVGAEATPDEIQAAYTRLMRMAHPDKGGTAGLAAQLNAARERLLKP